MADTPLIALPNTSHSVFYAHSICVNGKAIGSFERMSVRSTKTSERIREVLYAHGAETNEILWGGTDISIDLNRVEVYRDAFIEALGFPLTTLESINQKFDVVEIQINPASNEQRITTYMDCVPTSWSKDIDTGTAKIVEAMTFEVRTVSVMYQ